MTPTAVAIVNYNTRDHLRECLETVLPQRPAEIVVVDNDSSDGSVEMMRERFPNVRLIQAENRGYGAAANLAFAASSAPYVLLLNTDTLLRPGALEALVEYLDDNPQAGVVGPRLLNPDGSLQPSCFPFPSPLNVLLVGATLGRILFRPIPILRERFLRTWSHDGARVVPWVRGAAMCMRREAFRSVNGFDDSFFLYYEETDLCLRTSRAGWQTHFAPVTEVIHACETSTGGVGNSAFATRLYFQSLSRYFELHHAPLTALAAITLERIVIVARILHGAVQYLMAPAEADRIRAASEIGAWKGALTAQWREGAGS